jgi:hypothetical protein
MGVCAIFPDKLVSSDNRRQASTIAPYSLSCNGLQLVGAFHL